MSSNKTGICFACGKEGVRSICSRCKNADYCSVTCQKRDWKNHKPHCKKKKKESDEVVCSCPICGRDGLEKESPAICPMCGQLKRCEMCSFDKRCRAIGRGTVFCNHCVEQVDDMSFLECLQQLKDRLRPEDAGPLENALRLGYAGLQEDPDGPSPVKVDMKEVHRLADEVNYPPAMYVLGALYSGMNEGSESGQDAKDNFTLGAIWTSLFENSYTHCDEDAGKAQKCLRQAADLGYAPAMFMLGSFYMAEFDRDRGSVNNLRDADILLREAANIGHANAAILLARLIGDPSVAELLGEDACDREEATRLLKRVVRKGPPEVAESARRMLEVLSIGESD